MKKLRTGGKTRITIRLDDGVLQWFRSQVRSSGGSYQSLINLALRDHISREPLEATLRRVVREELAHFSGASLESAYAYRPGPKTMVADADDTGGHYGAFPVPAGRRGRRASPRKKD